MTTTKPAVSVKSVLVLTFAAAAAAVTVWAQVRSGNHADLDLHMSPEGVARLNALFGGAA